MSWAQHAKIALQRGESVTIKPRGHSMKPRVHDGDHVTLEPTPDAEILSVDDVVLVRVRGRDFLHLIKAIDSQGRFLIGNNRGGTNGWVSGGSIFGRATRIERA